jgi:hypothetical protein
MAATNKCLAQSNKSRTGVPATNKGPAARRNSSARRQFGETRCGVSACRSFTALWRRELGSWNMSCLYSTACVYGVTALTVAIWSIPLLFVVIWRLTKASIGIRDLVFLGLLGLIFLIQVVSSLISPNATMGLIYILAGAAK